VNRPQAANYLDIKALLDLTCKTVADYIKQCKTPQEIRRRFNIKNGNDTTVLMCPLVVVPLCCRSLPFYDRTRSIIETLVCASSCDHNSMQ